MCMCVTRYSAERLWLWHMSENWRNRRGKGCLQICCQLNNRIDTNKCSSFLTFNFQFFKILLLLLFYRLLCNRLAIYILWQFPVLCQFCYKQIPKQKSYFKSLIVCSFRCLSHAHSVAWRWLHGWPFGWLPEYTLNFRNKKYKISL